MRRTVSLLLAGILLFLVAAGFGSWTARRLAPERVRAETQRWLSERLGGPVEIGEVQPVFHRGIALAAHELRSGDPEEGPGLRVEDALLVLDLRGLLLGGTPVRRVALRHARIRLERDEKGRWYPPTLAARIGLGHNNAGTPSPHPGLAARLLGAVRLLLNAPSVVPSIDVEDSEVHLEIAQWEGARYGPAVFSLRHLELHVVRRLFGTGLRLQASGRATHPSGAEGRFETRGDLRRAGGLDLEFVVHELDLALLEPLLSMFSSTTHLEGRGNGSIRWAFVGPDEQRVDADLRLREVTASLPRVGEPGAFPIELPTLHVRLAGEVQAQAIRLRDVRLSTGSSQVRGSGSLELPLAPQSSSFVALRAWNLPLPAVKEGLLRLLPARFATLRRVAQSLEAGRVVSLLVSCPRATTEEWKRLFRPSFPPAWPEGLSAEIALAELAARVGAGSHLDGLTARLTLNRHQLELSTAGGHWNGEPVPVLELALRGVERLAASTGNRPAALPALPGAGVLDAWIREGLSADPTHPSWSSLQWSATRVEHPALLRPIEGAEATLRRTEQGLQLFLERARWGGVPLRGEASLEGAPPGKLVVTVAADAPERVAAATGSEVEGWGEGRLRVQLQRVGSLPARVLQGDWRASWSRLSLLDARLDARPVGRLRGDLELNLSQSDQVPFRARFQLEDGSLEPLLGALGFEASGLDGQIVLAADLRGGLRPGRPLLADARGPVSVHARNGTIRRRLPVVIALAEASETLNPLASRDAVRYRAVDAQVRLENGSLRADSLSLDGPTLRLVATGQVDVLRGSNPLEAVVGIFFFRKLDAMIDKVPLLNRLLLGADENFVAAYFALSGPWAHPKASFIPTRSLASGPGSVVLVGLPSFVRGGLERLQTLVVGGWKAGGEILGGGEKP